MSASDPAFCLSYLAHSLLFVNNLNWNGSHEQKQRYLPGACSGSVLGGMCMSEPGAGTDVLGMTTSATRDGDSYVIKVRLTTNQPTNQPTNCFVSYALGRLTGRNLYGLCLLVLSSVVCVCVLPDPQGTKMWITNGAQNDGTTGDVFLVYAKTPVSGGGKPSHSLFLVEKGMPGFTVGTRIRDKCGMVSKSGIEQK